MDDDSVGCYACPSEEARLGTWAAAVASLLLQSPRQKPPNYELNPRCRGCLGTKLALNYRGRFSAAPARQVAPALPFGGATAVGQDAAPLEVATVAVAVAAGNVAALHLPRVHHEVGLK